MMTTKIKLLLPTLLFGVFAFLASWSLGKHSASTVRFGSGEMFDAIATYYDQANEYLSLGLHTSWKLDLLYELKLSPETKLLDLATGTADIAIMAAREYKSPVVGVDPSVQMLAVGREKVKKENLIDLVFLQIGDAGNLENILSDSFDRVSISFGIRNFPYRLQALRETFRVMKKGGYIGILELAPPNDDELLGKIVSVAVKSLVPIIGWFASGRAAEYAYLERSIFDFPKNFETVIEDAGFTTVKVKSFMGGLIKVFVARK